MMIEAPSDVNKSLDGSTYPAYSKWLGFINRNLFWQLQHPAGFQPGAVAPPSADGASMRQME